ncbi:MAG: PEP-CTERM sorting domain-containing protein, partial [Verrucomicrobia bacterium]|nr:PEP-CTERM sorting domain-containing protein [Verrucomicrobiota bacterium]
LSGPRAWSLGGGKPPQNFNTDRDAAPEPSIYAALAGLVTLGFVLVRRRRR